MHRQLDVREVYTSKLFVAPSMVAVRLNWVSVPIALCLNGYDFSMGICLCIDGDVKLYK